MSNSVNCITTPDDIQTCRESIWLEENPCVEDHGGLYRVTVIRNLPQLPDEMAGAELIHGPQVRQSSDRCPHGSCANKKLLISSSSDGGAPPLCGPRSLIPANKGSSLQSDSP